MAPWLFWHRRDLRLADNLGLAAVSAITLEVTGVFVLDPAELEHPTMAPARRWFLLESLRELQQRWQQAGSQLLLLQGNPVELLPRLAQQLGAAGVAWNRDVEPLVRQRDRELATVLKAIGVRVAADWDQLLVPPEQLKTGGGDPYRVYGPYWRSWEKQPKAKPVPAPSALKALSELDLSGLPVLDEVPVASWEGADLCPCRPGETAALEQLEQFSARAMENYGEGRNLPGDEGTSTLSAALRAGSLSPRTAWAASLEVLSHCRSDEQRQSVTVWQQELAWREFYQQALFHFPELADGPYRPQWRQFPWEDDPARLKAWQDGLTGVPIVDAAMRQLVQTGFMHNRCRMIVASFLVKDLICDWRHGEAFFMAHAVDGDLAANNGGWQWSASSGMDPKPLRSSIPSPRQANLIRRPTTSAAGCRSWLTSTPKISLAGISARWNDAVIPSRS